MDVPTAIELKVGEAHTLRLQGLGTAGYVWNCTVEGNANVIEVTVGRDSQSQQPDDSVLFGSSLDEIYTVLGRETGQTTIHLAQRRLWETDQPPLKNYRIEITVQP